MNVPSGLSRFYTYVTEITKISWVLESVLHSASAQNVLLHEHCSKTRDFCSEVILLIMEILIINSTLYL